MFVLAPIHMSPEVLTVLPESKLWVEGTSTIRGFECKVPEFALKVNTDDGGAVAKVLAGQKAVRTAELTVPAATIDCGNGTMNEHMRKALKAEDNATIRFTLSGYDVASGAKGAEGTVHGTLSLGGAEHPVDVTASAIDAGSGAMRVVGSYEVVLSAFDLKRPSLMFGRIKVGDKVQVKFDLVLRS
jgi:polyisoprenoid-binding protein YceI